MDTLQSNGALRYHVLPPQGLLNDPNGLIHFKGLYHVFFQWNPHATDHGQKYWGHATSRDLVHFTYHPAALAPDDWFDKNGCYSGSAVEKDGKLYLFYTGNVKSEEGVRTSYQCAAVSEDGFHFEKLGPVTDSPAGYTAHVRDPKVFEDGGGGYWMLLGAQREDLSGDTILYHSADLMKWRFQGSLLEKREELGYMWECPDLVRFSQGDVFLFSPQGLEAQEDRYRNVFQTGYYLGKFEAGIFQKSQAEFDELDRGFEFYAPQTFEDSDGRCILFGWMGVMPPEVEGAVPTREEGWLHHLTIPRVLELHDGRLLQKPVEEMRSLRGQSWSYLGPRTALELPVHHVEMEMLWTDGAQDFKMDICQEVEIRYEESSRHLTVERTNWLTRAREERRVQLKGTLRQLQLFQEKTSLELFVNGGEEVFSLRYFAKSSRNTIRLEEKDASKPYALSVYLLEA